MAAQQSASGASSPAEFLPNEDLSDDDMTGGCAVFSSDEDSADESAIDAEVLAAETELLTNPYKYDQHILLINILKKTGDLEKLRNARQRMSDIFPLTEALWLDWMHDEMRMAVTADEKEAIAALFERANKDYLCECRWFNVGLLTFEDALWAIYFPGPVALWLEYAQFAIGQMGNEGGVEKCREVMERALVAAGLHVASGSVLWEVYREFELAVLCMKQHGEEQSLEEQEEENRQRARVMNLFKRQLTVPLLDMEKTFEELTEWAATEPIDQLDPNISLGFNKALIKLKKINKYEESLVLTESPTERAYLDYLDFELKEGEPARVQCLYERAIVENCLSPSLWEQYGNYVNSQLRISMIVLPIYERAIRNCPWSVKLWQGYIRALERYSEPRDKVKEVVERALTSGFTSPGEYRELWLTYLEYIRRQIDWTQDHADVLEILRATFDKAHTHLMEAFGVDGDPNCVILQYWARIEGRHCNNMERSREIWNQIINHLGHSHQAQIWLEHCNLERSCGDAKRARKVFIRGLMAASDWPELVGEAWLQFERDEGNLDQYETALSKIESRMKVVLEGRHKEVLQVEVKEQSKLSKRPTKKKHSADLSVSQQVTKRPKKRKFEDTTTTRIDGNDKPSTSKVDSDGFHMPAAPIKGIRPDKSSAKDKEPRKKKPKKLTDNALPLVGNDSARDERSVFLSNLSFNVDESNIREFFSQLGNVEDIRLVRDPNGRSRGFGYVEFSDADIALQALKNDRELLNGRPVFVSKCEDKSKRAKGPTFKYSENKEKKKLFVKGLPFSMTQQDVGNLFKAHGDVTDTRLVTYRNGNSKGYAFLEFKDEETAAHVQSKMDGVTVEGHTLSVAISNPSEGKRSGQKVDDINESFGQRTRGRTQISLLPRALMKASLKQEPPAVPVSMNGSGDVTEAPKPMSNDQFRLLLLNK